MQDGTQCEDQCKQVHEFIVDIQKNELFNSASQPENGHGSNDHPAHRRAGKRIAIKEKESSHHKKQVTEPEVQNLHDTSVIELKLGEILLPSEYFPEK